jgi:hypothetical protein
MANRVESLAVSATQASQALWIHRPHQDGPMGGRNRGDLCGLVVLSLVGGLACAGLDDSVTSAIRRDGGSDVLSDVRKGAPSPPCVEKGILDIEPRPADILIVFDRSGSMDTALGATSRYQALAALVSDLVTTYQRRVRFGYLEMPSRSACETQAVECCASWPSVELALNNAEAIKAAIVQAAPVAGNAPTASALLEALAYYNSLEGGSANPYVLLATDGVSNCELPGGLSQGKGTSSFACVGALAAVQTLFGNAVKVLVLSVGAESASAPGGADCLDGLARAGGAELPPVGPGYYSVADPDPLRRTIERTFGAKNEPSCLLHPDPIDRDKPVTVRLDGFEIPQDPSDGWRWDASLVPPGIRITGAYCKRIQTFQVNKVEVDYSGCGGSPPTQVLPVRSVGSGAGHEGL